MNIKKYGVLLLLLVLIVSLSACNTEKVSLTLINEFDVTQEIDDLEKGSTYVLPIPEVEGMLFVGWESDDNIYYDEIKAEETISLEAVFEVVTDVFEYEFNHEQETIALLGYSGRATHLKIPQTIDGFILTSIRPYSFEESSLVEVIFPVDLFVGDNAFLNSTELKVIDFYGDFLVTQNATVPNIEFDEMTTEHSDTCVIVEGSIEEGTWTYGEGCPYKEVLNVNPEIEVGGIIFFSYNVLVDPNYYPLSFYYSFGRLSFKGATSLETVYMSKIDAMFFPDAFEGCINLKEVIADRDSDHFTSLDGVLYSKDLSKLMYYPSGKEGSNYTMLDSVDTIYMQAFIDNQYIETLTINEIYRGEFSLLGLNNLKEIKVHDNNDKFTSIDGVLFDGDNLVKYPAAKEGSSYSLPTGTRAIVEYAFSNNKNLETIDLGTELYVISMGAFSGSESLTELNIPASVVHISMYITLEFNINTIIINRSFVIDGTVTYLLSGFGPIDESVFKVYVPDDSIEKYLEEMSWSQIEDLIYVLSEYQ